MIYTASIVVEKNEEGYYAWCPHLKGCQTQGDTLEETLAHAKEAVEVYLEALTPDEREEIEKTQVFHTSVTIEV